MLTKVDEREDKFDLAFLVIEGELKRSCIGCTAQLYRRRMLDIALATTLDSGLRVAVYEITPPHTLADCRLAVKASHLDTRSRNPLDDPR